MLDGRVLGASQVEYKPFGKRPLKREPLDLAWQSRATLLARRACPALFQAYETWAEIGTWARS